MKTYKKFILAVSLVTVLAAPLSACSRTWDGVKEDWQNVTSGDGDERVEAPPAPAPAPEAAPVVIEEPQPGYQLEAPKGDNSPMRLNP